MKNLVIGIVLILIALGLLAYWPGVWNSMASLIAGAIPLAIILLGLAFLMIGWDEMKGPAPVSAPSAPKPRRKR